MKIAFLVLPNMLTTSLSNAYELFFAAKQAAKMRRMPIAAEVELAKVATSLDRLELPSGLSMRPDRSIDDAVFDIVYVPALWRNPEPIVRQNPTIVDWLKYQYQHGAIINGTGTGVCFIAETGILDQRPATTHWHYLEKFAKRYPQVELKRQHFITSAGRLYCAGSINAQTDLNLHHVHRVFGKEIADHLSQHFSHEVRQPFDRLSFDQDSNTNHPDETILQAQLWMQNNIADHTVSISNLASHLGLSQRSLNRRFRDATNVSPIKYLQSQRLSQARELLKHSNLSISEIAYRVGYLDVSYFSKLFRQFYSATPRAFRSSLRAKMFSSEET